MYGRSLYLGGMALLSPLLSAILARVLQPLIDALPPSANGGIVLQSLQVVRDHSLTVMLLAIAFAFFYGAYQDRRTGPEPTAGRARR